MGCGMLANKGRFSLPRALLTSVTPGCTVDPHHLLSHREGKGCNGDERLTHLTACLHCIVSSRKDKTRSLLKVFPWWAAWMMCSRFPQKKVTMLYPHIHCRLLRVYRGQDNLYWHNQGGGGTCSRRCMTTAVSHSAGHIGHWLSLPS